MSTFQGFNKRYQDELKEEIAVTEAAILTGNIEDLCEYRKLVGRRHALVYALERHQELITLMEQAND